MLILFSSSYTTEQSPPADDPINLLINAGFEQDQNNRPIGWRAVTLPGGDGTIEFVWDDAYAYQGERSLRIDVEGTKRGIWSQTVIVEEGATYEISGYVAFENLAPRSDAHLQIVFRDDSGRLLEFALCPSSITDYPESIRPYLESDNYVTVDDPIVRDLAAEILSSMPEAARDNAVAVAWAVYAWISTTINHDAVYGNRQPYLDVTLACSHL